MFELSGSSNLSVLKYVYILMSIFIIQVKSHHPVHEGNNKNQRQDKND